MELQTWLNGLIVVSAAFSSIYLLLASFRQKSIMLLVFAMGLLFFCASKALYFFEESIPEYLFYKDYLSIAGVSSILIGLFILIRNSKPVFARFPAQFTLLPLIVIPFYPMLSETLVLRELVSIIFQAGALVVAFLILFINQYKKSEHGWVILGCVFLTAVFLMKWVFAIDLEYSWIWEILLASGIIVSSIGFHKLKPDNSNSNTLASL